MSKTDWRAEWRNEADENIRLRKINEELLEALKDARLALMPNVQGGTIDRVAVQTRIDAAITKAESR